MISKFTPREGGPWYTWTNGYVSDFVLKQKHVTALILGDRSIILNGCLVHALRMDDGKEWDCINGWRK